MSLKEIFCQDRAIGILQKAFASSRMAHAYIFAGVDGIGKFKTAYQWGKMLLCQNPVSTEDGFRDSCGLCRSCELFEAGSHPDFAHVYKELIKFTRDGKNRKTPVDLPIDVIREFLIAKAPAKPVKSQRKVFVISEAEKLNIASQNALLKVLEEPPEYCCVILLCTRMEKLLPTIKSRCQLIRFGPIEEARIIGKLKETDLDEIRCRYFARFCRGSIGEAWQLGKLEEAGADFYQTKQELLDSVSRYEYAESLEIAEWLLNENKRITDVWSKLDENVSKTDIGRRVVKSLVRIIISALQDTIKLNLAMGNEIINFDQKEQMESMAGRFDVERAAEKINNAYKTMLWIESNVNERLIFEQLLLNLVSYATIQF